jgi:hypothetical protein
MFSDENLNPGFIQAYNSGDRFRVLVDFGYDKPIWGYVGVTSGWQPMFLLMRRRGQRGSSDTIGPEAKIIATKFLKD